VKLHLAKNLALPADEAVTQKYGFIGAAAPGKATPRCGRPSCFWTTAPNHRAGLGRHLVESPPGGRRQAAGVPACLHLRRRHADVPLEATSGALMADLVVDKHISVVLDVMHFRKAERTRFATSFANSSSIAKRRAHGLPLVSRRGAGVLTAVGPGRECADGRRL